MKITYGIEASPGGPCLLGITEGRICILAFLNTTSDTAAQRAVKERWSEAELVRSDKAARSLLKKIFAEQKNNASLPLVLKGTTFQLKVWEALRAIPFGTTARYADIARAIGSPKAVRAVGTACGKNPVGFIIPCHRVIASNGTLGGYHWGVERKEALLAWEAAHV